MDQLPSTLDEDDGKGLVAAHERSEGGGGDESMEKMFERLEVAAWEKQLTTRALLVSFVLSLLFSVIVIKLNLTTGLAPGFNVSAGLLGYFFIKTWTKFLEKSRLLTQPFTRQENTVIQTCVVASCSVASSGGFGSYLLGMSQVVANQSTEANDPQNVKNLSLSWMIGFLFLISFLGLFSVLPLRKIMIIDFKLIYPSGSATAHLINSFHTPSGANLATKQVRTLGKYFSLSFLWGFFQWFFAATEGCGFANFPTFGLKAFQNKFYFDFSATYIGVGMVCPYITNVSLLLGAFMSWGVMWPLIEKKKGDWFSSDLPTSSLQSLQGYRVFIAIAMILGDGLYNFFKVLGRTFHGLYNQLHHIMMGQSGGRIYPPATALSYDDERRTQLFLNDKLPTWFAFAGYITIAIISTATIPHIFHQLKWYHIVVIYIFSPALAFCNAYGSGLTNWSMSPTYGKLAIFVIGAWVGSAHGGVIAGLAACGVMMNIVSTASDLMQDFKTGYMTLASPRSMFVSQIIGTAMGSVISPCVFWIFLKAFPDLGLPNSQYPAPYALIYRNVAILSVEGVSSLPKHCLTLCYVFFALALIINGVKDAVGPKWARFIPLPMAMSIPFYLGGSFAVDMCVGSLILLVWESIDKANADALGAAVASGLICGEGIWTLPSSMLSLAGVKPPICMKFLSRKDSARVDDFLAAS